MAEHYPGILAAAEAVHGDEMPEAFRELRARALADQVRRAEREDVRRRRRAERGGEWYTGDGTS